MIIDHEDVKDPQKLAENICYPEKLNGYDHLGYMPIRPHATVREKWKTLNEILQEISLEYAYTIECRENNYILCIGGYKSFSADTRIEAAAKALRWCREQKETKI